MSRSRKPRRARQSGRILGILLLLAIVVGSGLAGLWGWLRYHDFVTSPLAGIEAGERIRVERGDSLSTVLARLREAGVHDGHRLEWRLLARQLGAAASLHVGEYALEPGMTPRDLLIAMRTGETVQYRFTIVEGWNIRELRAALAAAAPLEHETTGMDNAELMAALGHGGQHPEGRFLPETYLYSRGDSDLDLLARAHTAMESALADAWEGRDRDLPVESADELLTLASIVEKETGIAEERPRIAGVFVRRLEKGMLLQTDPTVIYGMGEDYEGNIRRRDLRTDTPYNTYTRAGLPPTPIAMPGVAALQAAAHPAPGEALYFVAIGDGSGRHRFARTLAEHQANVRTYLREYHRNRASAQ